MRIPEELICKTCRKFFCCAKCRHRHEIRNHAIIVQKPVTSSDEDSSDNAPIYLFCPICEGKPLPLYEEMYDEMLRHVERNHMPLHCKKCNKLYTKIDDLKEFTKCLRTAVFPNDAQECSAVSDQTCDTDASKVTVTKAPTSQTTISTQTSPMRRCGGGAVDDFDNTSMSIINLHWKAKSKVMHEEFISDSVSSIKNLSSISNSSIRRSIGLVTGPKGKLVRTTSTPVNAEMIFAKPKEQTFNASGGQVSSIYNSGCDLENNPPIINCHGTPSKQPLDNMNRYFKVGGRAKMSSVTPLRQVMSKSIQKAFAEHGLPPATGRYLIRKKMFDSTDTSTMENTASTGVVLAVGGGGGAGRPQSPLDLRLSPAVRRTQSESGDYYRSDNAASAVSYAIQTPQIHREILLSSQKLTTESIVITRTQHLASVESSSSSSNSSTSHRSIQTNASSTTGSDQSTSSSSATCNGSSVYKTCRSVEIITSTELSQVNVKQQNKRAFITATEEEGIDELRPLHPVAQQQLHVPGFGMAPITPITRIPGAVIHKKLIKFETPTVEVPAAINVNENGKRQQSFSPGEVFFTPEGITPVRKSKLRCGSSASEDGDGKGRHLVPRNLSGRLSPLRRPSIRDCAQSTAFSRIENVIDDEEDSDDEELTPRDKVEEIKQKEQDQPKKSVNATQPPPATAPVGRTWSFSSIMSSVMRLGGKEKENVTTIDTDVNSNSIIMRCASIAGSLVRSKPLIDEEQQKSLKRKRTYTTDSQYPSSFQQDHDYSATSTKRFRIQARKPIERMRINS